MTISVLLVNPWKREIEAHRIGDSIEEFYRLLRSDALDSAFLGEDSGLKICIFVDDHSLITEPRAPMWRVPGYPHVFAGYGLVTAADSVGASVDLPDDFTPAYFAPTYRVQWEIWEDRLNPADYPEHVI